MMKLEFKDWLKLQEVGTGSNCVASFARQTMPMVRRGTFGCSKDNEDNGKCGLAGDGLIMMRFSNGKFGNAY